MSGWWKINQVLQPEMLDGNDKIQDLKEDFCG